MRKNKSKKTKIPVLDEKSYAAYLDYLKGEDDRFASEGVRNRDASEKKQNSEFGVEKDVSN